MRQETQVFIPAVGDAGKGIVCEKRVARRRGARARRSVRVNPIPNPDPNPNQRSCARLARHRASILCCEATGAHVRTASARACARLLTIAATPSTERERERERESFIRNCDP